MPTTPASYFGLYAEGVPASYAGVTSFTKATGVRPNLAVYYSGWYEPFQASFATAASLHGAVPVVQINPTGISLADIASGHFDAYIRSYARAVRSYRRPVVLSFGHEMNGQWYSWGYRHTAPATFVAAWRRIVRIFRRLGASNVTWMWTVNTIGHWPRVVPDPTAWWPGSSYVNWVGVDGYFHKSYAQFASVFGPTIVKVRELTRDPILIAETGAPPNTGQPAKIAALFAGVRRYGLLGFLWFDNVGRWDYRVRSHAALGAFRANAQTYPSRSN